MKLSIIIPCFNENKYIEKVIDSINAQKIEDKEIIVVDDASTDGTKEKLTELKEKKKIDILIHHEINLGKGGAVRSALKKSTGEIIIIQDADLEYSPKDFFRLIKPIAEGKADVVYGSRFLGGGEDAHRVLYFWHRVANGILTTLANILTDMNLTDMETGYKAFKKNTLDNISIEENRFGFEPEITIKLAKKKLKFFEVGVSYNGRTYDEGKKIGIKDGFRAVYCLFKYKFF
jgi:glycosyltransferase involved in cell wall biosynthesis